jgi:hypothetical protein
MQMDDHSDTNGDIGRYATPGGISPELARAYVPPQQYVDTFPLPEALAKGTLFPDLFKPYTPFERPAKR